MHCNEIYSLLRGHLNDVVSVRFICNDHHHLFQYVLESNLVLSLDAFRIGTSAIHIYTYGQIRFQEVAEM